MDIDPMHPIVALAYAATVAWFAASAFSIFGVVAGEPDDLPWWWQEQRSDLGRPRWFLPAFTLTVAGVLAIVGLAQAVDAFTRGATASGVIYVAAPVVFLYLTVSMVMSYR